MLAFVSVSGLDAIIAIMVLLFAGIGVLRGGLREFISLATWTVSILVASLFSAGVAGWLTWPGDIQLRRIAAFIVLFAAVFVVVTLIALVFRLLFFASMPGLVGRIFGGMLGAFRGMAVVVVLVLLAGLTSFPQKPWWRDSALAPYFESVALGVRHMLPENVAHQFRYS